MRARIVALLCGVSFLGACATGNPAAWREETGLGVCPPWRKPNVGREMARQAAIGEAREKILASVLELNIDGRTRVEDLAVADPRFLSKLRGVIAGLHPVDVSDRDAATIAVKMRIDENEVLALARKHMAKMGPAGPRRSGAGARPANRGPAGETPASPAFGP